jgi:hypothetical protein
VVSLSGRQGRGGRQPPRRRPQHRAGVADPFLVEGPVRQNDIPSASCSREMVARYPINLAPAANAGSWPALCARVLAPPQQESPRDSISGTCPKASAIFSEKSSISASPADLIRSAPSAISSKKRTRARGNPLAMDVTTRTTSGASSHIRIGLRAGFSNYLGGSASSILPYFLAAAPISNASDSGPAAVP